MRDGEWEERKKERSYNSNSRYYENGDCDLICMQVKTQ